LSAPEAARYDIPTLSIGLRLLGQTSRSTTAVHEEPLTQLCCEGCGYGVSCRTVPDRCPMCHGTEWAYAAWRPFSHALLDA
jgi:hypothetical protein